MRKFLIASVLILLPVLPMFSQTLGDWKWTTLFDTIGAINTEAFHMDIAVDASDNVYLMGVFRDADLVIGTETLTNMGNYDIFICSFDPVGNFRWARSIGSSENEDIAGLVVDGSNLYVGGAYKGAEVFFSHSATSLQPDNNYDSFLAHYLTDGTFQGAKRVFWGTKTQRLKDIVLDDVNNYLVAIGLFKDHLVYGSGVGDTLALVGPGTKDNFIARFDISGGFSSLALTDVKNFGSDQDGTTFKNINNSIIGTTHEGYYISGDLYGYIPLTDTDTLKGTNTTASDAMVIKLDENLDYVWSRRGGAGGNDHVNSAISDDEGSIYLSGKYESDVTFDSTAVYKSSVKAGINAQDLYIAKYYRDGRLLWSDFTGEIGNDDAFGLSLDEDFVQVAGNVAGTGNTNTGFIKYDHEGIYINRGEIFGDGDDVGKGVAFDSQGNTLIAGYFDSDTIFFGSRADPDTILVNNESGGYDGFLAKYQYPLTIVREEVRNSTCNGDDDGYILVKGEFGVPPYSWSWEDDPGNTTPIAQDLAPGKYIVTLTDSDVPATVVKDSITITEPDLITINRDITDVKCYGEANGEIDITVMGGNGSNEYLWSPSGSGPATDEDQVGLLAGDYHVTVTDINSCQADSTFTVSQPFALTVSGNVTPVSSNGAGDGAIDITASGGTAPYDYSWTGPDSFSSTDEDITDLDGGNYTVVVTDDNSCDTSRQFSVPEPGVLVVDAQAVAHVLCNGGNDGKVVVTATGGVRPYTYEWSPNSSVTDSFAVNLTAGKYYVTVTDASMVSETDSAIVAQPAALSVLLTAYDATCYGDCNGRIEVSVSGGTPPYSYSWSGPDGYASTDKDISGLCSGSYTLTVTDANGCQKISNTSVDEPPPYSVIVTPTSPSCTGDNDGDITLTVTGATSPYTYLWSNGQTTNRADFLAAGAHSCVITDDNGCDTTVVISLTDPPPISISPTANGADCFYKCNGDASANASGGTGTLTYLWNDGQTTSTAINLCPGIHKVRVTDSKGCVDSSNVLVNVPDTIKLTINKQDAGCDTKGAISVSPVGGTSPYTYLWSDFATTQVRTDLDAGDYTVTVTDNVNCSVDSTITVAGPEPIVVDLVDTGSVTSLSCNGDTEGKITLTAGGGAPPFEFSIDDGTTYSADSVFTGLAAGTFNTKVKDNDECEQAGPVVTITEPSLLSIDTVNTTNISCAGAAADGSVNISVSGGVSPYEYSTNGGTNWSVDSTFTGLAAGSYTPAVRDNNNCIATGSLIELTEPAALSVSNEAKTDVTCNGLTDGTITITASGGTSPYAFTLNPGAIETNATGLFENLGAGSYSISVDDANNCGPVTSSNLVIAEPDSIVIDSISLKDETPGMADGAIFIQASGGTGSLSYTLVEESSTNSTGLFENLIAGTYSLNITDENNCTASLNTQISEADTEIEIYDAFTPNGDGVNDVWNIKNIGLYPDCMIKIYNIWGNLVFSSDGYAEPWDGKRNGSILPADTYFYVIDLGDGSEVFTGTVNIVK